MDYLFRRDNGLSVPVSEMTDLELSDCLGDGDFVVHSGPLRRKRIMERLRIEQLIRTLGL